MHRLGVFASALVFMNSLGWAIDKEFLAEHIRAALNEPPQTDITIGDELPSEFEGLKKMIVKIQDFENPIYLSKDERYYFWGRVFDTTQNPDAKRMKAISMKGVYFKGANKAPVTIVEYSDLQCGYCQKAHIKLEEELYKHYSKKDVKLVFKHFPLAMHKWAMDGAVAAECAGKQGNAAFWGMINKFFRNAKSVTPENVKDKALEYAGDLKINKRKLKACIEDPKIVEKINQMRREGATIGVQSTPTFFVNGRAKRGFRTLDDLKPLIDQKLAEAKNK